MYQASIWKTLLLCCFAVLSGHALVAQQEHTETGESMEHAEQQEVLAMSATLEVHEPILITREYVQQVQQYQQYLVDLKEWQTEALVVAKKLQDEGKLAPKTDQEEAGSSILRDHLLLAGVESAIARNQLFSFPKSVLNEMPPAPELVKVPNGVTLNMTLRLTNNTEQVTQVNSDIYCDVARVDVSVTGPGVYRIPQWQFIQTTDWQVGEIKNLQPGQSHDIPIKRLVFGYRGMSGDWAVTEPGEHEITVKYAGQTGFAGADQHEVPVAKAMVSVKWKEADQDKDSQQ